MIKIVKNRLLDALLKLMLVSAGLHVVVVVFFALIKNNIRVLNYFSIIGLDLFIPDLSTGFVSHIIAILITLVLYLVILFFFTEKN
jgi:hypothetical protein